MRRSSNRRLLVRGQPFSAVPKRGDQMIGAELMKRKSTGVGLGVGLGVALGAALGAALGVAAGHLAIWLAIVFCGRWIAYY